MGLHRQNLDRLLVGVLATAGIVLANAFVPDDAGAAPPGGVKDVAVVGVSLEQCCIKATFENKGTTTINMQNLKGEVFKDGAHLLFLAWQDVTLAPGQTVEWRGHEESRLIGSHLVRVVVDSQNVLPEVNESNNSMEKRLGCPLPAGARAPVALAKKPDLKPVVKFHVVQEGDDAAGHFKKITMKVLVRNTGTADAGVSYVKLETQMRPEQSQYVAASPIWLNGVPAGEARETGELTYTLRNPQRLYVRATADMYDVIDELDDSPEDNTATGAYPESPLHR